VWSPVLRERVGVGVAFFDARFYVRSMTDKPAEKPAAPAAPSAAAAPAAAAGPAPAGADKPAEAPVPTLADKLGVAGATLRAAKDGIETVLVPAARFADAARALRDTLGFVRFIDLSVVDLVETGRADRFEVYLLVYSMKEKRHARLQATTDSEIPSVTPLFEGAHNYEREAYDLFGVVFAGHPALTRIMMPDGWQGHPLRRDYEMPFEPVDFTVTRDVYNT
jgi:NADH-quinone oxidoreductase subunit C